ncbi:MAG: NifU family protein [Bacteroidota bacterium]
MDTNQKKELIHKIDAALDTVRPHLAADGGDVEVVELTDDMTVKVKWLGNCENCFMSIMTMKAGIEEAIKTKVPEVQHVEAINGVEMPG